MNAETLRQAVSLAEELALVLVASADGEGLPHLSAAGKLTAEGDRRVGVGAWFCPGTLANVQRNPKVSLVVWDRSGDRGYQLLGEVERVDDLAIMDGYMPEPAKARPIPQVERQLLVRVEKIYTFSHAPHRDEEE